MDGKTLLLILAACCLIPLVTMEHGLAARLWNRRNPRRTVPAQVVKLWEHHYERMGRAGRWEPWRDFHAAFETEAGERLEFQLPARVYWRLKKGSRGRLTYRGTRFYGFDTALP